MPDAIAAVISLLCCICVAFHVNRTVDEVPELQRHRTGILILGLAWILIGYLRGTVLLDSFRNPDSIAHEEASREIASLLLSGNLTELSSAIRLGNQSYRTLCGAFYALTGGSIACPYVINAAAAFCGLTTLLQILTLKTHPTKLPGICVLLVLAAPSPLVWCTTHLKEGLMCWAICTMLRLTVHRRLLPSGALEWCAVGIAASFRPHIFAAWCVGVLVGSTRQRNLVAVFAASILGCVGLVALVSNYMPQLLTSFGEEGVSETMVRFHGSRDNMGGSRIRYSSGQPVPVVSGLCLLLFRPHPFEVHSTASLFAGLEYWLLTTVLVWGWLTRPRIALQSGCFFLSLLAVLTVLAFEFSYMYNMGLMVRYRVQAFPALICLSLTPYLTKRSGWREVSSTARQFNSHTFPRLGTGTAL